jgi:hypothetical protein
MKKILFGVCFSLFVGLIAFADGNDRRILQIIRDCERETGVSIQINGSGTRPVHIQAELMAKMNSSQLNMYGSSTWYVVEMKNCTLTGSARVTEFERLINDARRRGSFVSKHLTADAVDIAPSTSAVQSYLNNHGVSIKDETEDGIRCWHLELQ